MPKCRLTNWRNHQTKLNSRWFAVELLISVRALICINSISDEANGTWQMLVGGLDCCTTRRRRWREIKNIETLMMNIDSGDCVVPSSSTELRHCSFNKFSNVTYVWTTYYSHQSPQCDHIVHIPIAKSTRMKCTPYREQKERDRSAERETEKETASHGDVML